MASRAYRSGASCQKSAKTTRRQPGSSSPRRGLNAGAHESIVKSAEHGEHLATLDDRRVEQVLQAYRERYHDLAADRRVRYVQIFKNHGERAGASFSHPHSQIIAIPIVPLRILEEFEGVRAHAVDRDGECLFCEILRRELSVGRRVVAENGAFVALEPFAARFPFE